MKPLSILISWGIAISVIVASSSYASQTKLEKEKPFAFPNRVEKEIEYGKELFVNTAKYLGPKGSIGHFTNFMNCQNCHLDAGTRPFGISLTMAFRHFPDYRARNNRILSLADRVNDCIQRPLNGKPLDVNSREMRAITVYLRSIASSAPIGKKEWGEDINDVITLIDRAADPKKGAVVYQSKCASCHMQNGEGVMDPSGTFFIYPAMWGGNSYPTSTNMHRVLRVAAFSKANMPFGTATWKKPILTNEEAFDVAAFINDDSIHPRPPNPFEKEDYEVLEEKFVDLPDGPWADPFPALAHKFGPFPPILKYLKQHGLPALY